MSLFWINLLLYAAFTGVFCLIVYAITGDIDSLSLWFALVFGFYSGWRTREEPIEIEPTDE